MTCANPSDISAAKTHSELQLVRKPSDWMAGSGPSLVRHVPTKTVFEISPRPGMRADDVPTPDDLRARLVQVGKGAALPANVNLELLCGEGIFLCEDYAYVGAVQLKQRLLGKLGRGLAQHPRADRRQSKAGRVHTIW